MKLYRGPSSVIRLKGSLVVCNAAKYPPAFVNIKNADNSILDRGLFRRIILTDQSVASPIQETALLSRDDTGFFLLSPGEGFLRCAFEGYRRFFVSGPQLILIIRAGMIRGSRCLSEVRLMRARELACCEANQN
jgi:hypothetical protein